MYEFMKPVNSFLKYMIYSAINKTLVRNGIAFIAFNNNQMFSNPQKQMSNF